MTWECHRRVRSGRTNWNWRPWQVTYVWESRLTGIILKSDILCDPTRRFTFRLIGGSLAGGRFVLVVSLEGRVVPHRSVTNGRNRIGCGFDRLNKISFPVGFNWKENEIREYSFLMMNVRSCHSSTLIPTDWPHSAKSLADWTETLSMIITSFKQGTLGASLRRVDACSEVANTTVVCAWLILENQVWGGPIPELRESHYMYSEGVGVE